MKTFIQSTQLTAAILLSCASGSVGTVSITAHDGHPSGASHVVANQLPPEPGRVQMETNSTHRIIRSNGIPNHGVGQFPNRRNPNSIRAQNYTFRIPLNPQKAARPVELNRQPWGIAINGVLFDPGTAEYWQGDRSGDWNYEALSGKVNLGLDSNHAHVQPNGAYHYHGLPTGLWKTLSMGKPGMHLLGWAADGFPIYGPYAYQSPNDPGSPLIKMKSSYHLKPAPRASGPGGQPDGTFTADYQYAPGSGDLDECGGRTGVTPEYPQGPYYYVLTEDYPFIPRFFRGEPDSSFRRRGPGAVPPRGQRQGPPIRGTGQGRRDPRRPRL
jgi:hypothetical protein